MNHAHAGRGGWRSRALAVALVAAALLAVSGLLAAIYYRPYGHRAPTHVGVAVVLVAALRGIHRGAAIGLVVAAVAYLWPGRSRPGGGVVVGGLAIVTALAATGLVTPWPSLLPWTVPAGANMARPMPLLGHDGPFPELVGVNVTYDDTVLALGRLRLGPRGVGRLYLSHVVCLPIAALALAGGIVAHRRRRNRR